MIAMNPTLHTKAPWTEIGILKDANGRKRNVISDPNEKADHAVMAKAVGVERMARKAKRHFNSG